MQSTVARSRHHGIDLVAPDVDFTVADYRDLFTHVYAEPTPQLLEQQAMVAEELSREEVRS